MRDCQSDRRNAKHHRDKKAAEKVAGCRVSIQKPRNFPCHRFAGCRLIAPKPKINIRIHDMVKAERQQKPIQKSEYKHPESAKTYKRLAKSVDRRFCIRPDD